MLLKFSSDTLLGRTSNDFRSVLRILAKIMLRILNYNERDGANIYWISTMCQTLRGFVYFLTYLHTNPVKYIFDNISPIILEKAMATHSSTLSWKIPWTEEPGGLLSMGLHRVGHDWSDLQQQQQPHDSAAFASEVIWPISLSGLNFFLRFIGVCLVYNAVLFSGV